MTTDKNIFSHKDLIVWQKSMRLVVCIYEITEKFPKEEIFGLTSQMRRAAVSIPSNIAEGRCRSTRKDFSQFLRIAFGSAAELDTQIEIAEQLPKTKNISFSKEKELLDEIRKMLNVMISKMSQTNS
jgi:four helix bundle protein